MDTDEHRFQHFRILAFQFFLILASAGFPAHIRHRRTNENCSQPRTKKHIEKHIREAVKFGEHGKNPAAIMKKDLAIFEGHRIRRLYEEKTETWWFSIVDIIRVLTQQPDYKEAQNYWKVLKHRLNKEGSQLVTNCNQLKLEAAGYSDWLAADEAALDYIATRIAPKFGVSAEVIAKRLRVEKLWPPTDD